MEAARSAPDDADGPFDGLRAEASAAVGQTANVLRAVREQYRIAFNEHLSRLDGLREELEAAERAADAGAVDTRRHARRHEVEVLADAMSGYRSTLARLELAERTLEHTWLFLERGDGTLVAPGPPAGLDRSVAEDDIAMRIIEAQERERMRLAQEIHDGPAQALSNAIFQVDYIERIAPTDPTGAAVELRTLRESLRRELASVRDEINQLRPPVDDDEGLVAALQDAGARLEALSNARVSVDAGAPAGILDDGVRTVALRVAQEALHNVRKHAAAANVVVRTELDTDGSFILSISDDGRGFDVTAVAARGRRNFGLQFMQERAELIGGRFDVRSRPDDGTVVRLTVPTATRTGAEESR